LKTGEKVLEERSKIKILAVSIDGRTAFLRE
jgi:hypothetical protein